MPSANEIAVLRAARAEGIVSRDELANLMAQLGHESGGFARLEEGFRYTRGIDHIPVRSAFREGREALETARIAALDGRPQELARLMYGGRMGNDDAGDGYRYRGRGFTMLTGEANYRDAGTALGLDLVGRPEIAADREQAARIALWYWRERVPAADRDDVSAATRAINGGEIGLADRHNRFDAWNALLTPEFLADLDAGRVQPGASIQPVVRRAAMQDGALRRLETGAEVSGLQGDLRMLDLRDAGGRVVADTGTFDAATEQAVRRFQRDAGLAETGRADRETLQSISKAVERRHAPAENPPLRRGTDAPHEGHEPLPGHPTGDAALHERLSPQDTRLLDQLRGRVEDLDRAHGRIFDARSERACLSLLCLAKEHGISRIDHVVTSIQAPGVQAGENLFVVQGRLDDAAHRLAFMNTMDAMQAPVADSLSRLDSINRQAVQPEALGHSRSAVMEHSAGPTQMHRMA